MQQKTRTVEWQIIHSWMHLDKKKEVSKFGSSYRADPVVPRCRISRSAHPENPMQQNRTKLISSLCADLFFGFLHHTTA